MKCQHYIFFANIYTVILQYTNTLVINTDEKIFILQYFTKILYKYSLCIHITTTLRSNFFSSHETQNISTFLSNMKATREPHKYLPRNTSIQA
jgi:hypothetical protein